MSTIESSTFERALEKIRPAGFPAMSDERRNIASERGIDYLRQADQSLLHVNELIFPSPNKVAASITISAVMVLLADRRARIHPTESYYLVPGNRSNQSLRAREIKESLPFYQQAIMSAYRTAMLEEVTGFDQETTSSHPYEFNVVTYSTDVDSPCEVSSRLITSLELLREGILSQDPANPLRLTHAA